MKQENSVEGHSEALEAVLHDKQGNLTWEGIKELRKALNSPVRHFTVDLDIRKFKQFLKGVPGMTKQIYNQQVREYKEKAWGEYHEHLGDKGSFPTHNAIHCKEIPNVTK